MKWLTLEPGAWQAGRGYRKQPLATADDLDQAGTLVQVVEIPAGSVVEGHHHAVSYEFYYVMDGTCLLTVNANQPLTLRPGDSLLMEPGDVHRLENNGGETFRVLVFKTNREPDDTYWDAGAGRQSA